MTSIIRRNRRKRSERLPLSDDDDDEHNDYNDNNNDIDDDVPFETNDDNSHDMNSDFSYHEEKDYDNNININNNNNNTRNRFENKTGGNNDMRHSLNDIKMMISRQLSDSVDAIAPLSTSTSTLSTLTNICKCLCSWLCRLLQLCHTIAIVLLILSVLNLYNQVQVLTNQMNTEEELLYKIQDQLQTQQVSQEVLNVRVDHEHTLSIYQLAGTFTLLTCLITMFHMTQHMNNWYEPVIQRKIIAILWLSPIYSITSFLSLIFIQAHGYLAIIKDFYEAYVIYTFLSFLISVLGRGNRNVAILTLSYHANHLPIPTRCFNSCYHPPPNVSDQAKAGAVLLECQIWAMQFVLLRPITSIVRFILETNMILNNNNTDDNTNNNDYGYVYSPFFILDIITNISVGLAFHGLLKFYHAVHLDLEWCQPFRKFLTIKGIVFLTFWQGLLISILCNIKYQEEQVIYKNNNNSYNNNVTNDIVPTSFNTTTYNMNNNTNVSSMEYHNRTRLLLLFQDDHQEHGEMMKLSLSFHRLLITNDFMDKLDNFTDETVEKVENNNFINKLDNITNETFEKIEQFEGYNEEGNDNNEQTDDNDNMNEQDNSNVSSQDNDNNDMPDDNDNNKDSFQNMTDTTSSVTNNTYYDGHSVKDNVRNPYINETGTYGSSESLDGDTNSNTLNDENQDTNENNNDNNSNTNKDNSAREQAAHIQNLLICLEMLLFSIAHWCVFPAEEWSSTYMPKKETINPGIAFSDFASDISHIISSSSSRRAYNKQKRNNVQFLKDHEMEMSDHDRNIMSHSSTSEEDDEVLFTIDTSPIATIPTTDTANDEANTYVDPYGSSRENSIVTTDTMIFDHVNDNNDRSDDNNNMIHIRNSINSPTIKFAASDEDIEDINDLKLQEERNDYDIDGLF